jgi:hypothetical protein
MAFLFIIDEKSLFPNPETLLIEPFKSIWERDRTPKKIYAIEDFSYIEFISSMKKSNPYKDYPEDRKHDVIVKEIITREGWEVDGLIQEGIRKLEDLQKEGSTNYNYYMAAKSAVEKMQKFFLDVDITETNEKGALLYKPRDITSALNDTERVMTNLNSLKKKVEEEVYEATKNRADKVISPFADPNSLNKK